MPISDSAVAPPPGGAGNPQARADVALFFRLECLRELFQEQRNAVGKLLRGGSSSRPLRDLCLAPRDQLVAVVGQESVHP